MTAGPSHFDVIVVGGGIVGCAAAFCLARRGQTVAVVERGRIGGGTTSASFAWINATSKVADEAYHRLNALGAARYRELAVEFGEERLGLYPTGMLQWVNTRNESRHKAMHERARHLQSFGYPVSIVGAEVLAALEPHVRCDDDSEALMAMADPWLDAPVFARFLASELRAMGSAVFEHCAARELVLGDGGAVTGVVTEQGDLEAAKVLVAVGPNTPEVVSELTGYEDFAARFPLNRVPGLLVTTPSTAPAKLLRHIVYFDIEPGEVHLRPAPNGGLRIGADDTDGLVAEDASPEHVRTAAVELLRRTEALIPGFAGEGCIDDCELAIGVRPYPQDGKTMAGPLPGADGLYVMATHSGVTLALAIGQLMTDIIVDGAVPDLLRSFSLERFQGFG